MAQTSVGNYPIPDSTGANVRADINENLEDIYSTSSGSTPPPAAGSATGQLWIDTSTSPDSLKVKTGSGTTSANYTKLGDIATDLGHATSASPTFTGNIGFPAGSNSSLSIRNAADTDTGCYWGATNEFDIRAGNTDCHNFSASYSTSLLPFRSPQASNSAPGITFSGDEDTGLYRPGSNQIGFAIGGTWRGTITDDGFEIRGNKNLYFHDSDNSNWMALKGAGTIGSNFTITFPADDGGSNEVLKSDGSGTLSWTDTIANATTSAACSGNAATATWGGGTRVSSGTSESSAANIEKGRAKVWANIIGGTGSLRASHGISSCVRVSGGRYRLVFTTAFSNNDYALVAMGQYEASCGPNGDADTVYTTTQAEFKHGLYGTDVLDTDCLSVALFGNGGG